MGDVPSTVRPPMPCLLNLADQSTSKSSWECSVTRSPVPTPKIPSTPPSRPWTQNQMDPSTPPPSRPSSVPKPTNSTPKNSKTCSESPLLTETSWTTKDWPTPSPTVKPTSKYYFYFLVSHHTSLLLFIFPPLSCFSLSHVLSFVALFITTSIIDKKNRTYDLRDFFFIYLKSIEQQQLSIQTTQCMSLSTTIINLGDFYQKKPTLSVMSKVSIFR